MNFRNYYGFLESLFVKRGVRTRNVIAGSFSMLASSIIANLTRMGLVIILARYYTKEEFGIWATITATASVIAYGDFGIINALRNKLSILIVKGESGIEEAQKYFYSSFIFFLIISLIISSLVLLASHFVPFDVLFKTDNLVLKGQGVKIILWIQLLFFLNIPFSMGPVSFFSFQESKHYALFTTIQTLISFIVVVILILLKYSIVTISIGYFVSTTTISALGTYYFLKRRNWFCYKLDFKEACSQIWELLRIGVKFMGLQLSGSFLQNSGTFLAGSYLGLGSAAEFNLVQKLYAFLTSIYQSILNPLWGGYAEAFAKHDWNWCKKTLNVTLLMTIVIFSLAIMIFFFFGNYFLLVIAGKGYVTNKILFLVLGIAFLFVTLFSTATILQNATNKVNMMLVSLLTSSVLIFPVSKLLINAHGLIGLGFAMFLIWMILSIILTFQTYHIIGSNQKV
jgi:O-antigen/teichoic acid export membrane protein